MLSIKRTFGLLAVAGGVVLGFAAGADAPSADAGDATDRLQIEQLQVNQRGWGLDIAVTTRGRIRARGLAPQPSTFARSGRRHVCLRILQRGKRRLACFGPAAQGGLRLVAARISKRGAQRGKRWTATRNVSQRGSDTVRARVRFRALGLRAGRYRIRAVAAWTAHGCPGVDAEDTRARGVCRAARPRGGLRSLRLRRPRLVGCTASGPRLVNAGPRSRRRIALTFDDGPGPYTGRILDILNRANTRGTFYVIGSQVSGRTSLLRRMLRSGHAIGNHSWNHERNPLGSSLAATTRRIRAATGFAPCSFRPPYGVLSSRLIGDAHRLGMTTVKWDVDPSDWRSPGSAAIRSRVLASARPGSIVLLHDGGGNRSQTAAALPGIISTLKSRGYRFVTVPQILGQRMHWRP